MKIRFWLTAKIIYTSSSSIPTVPVLTPTLNIHMIPPRRHATRLSRSDISLFIIIVDQEALIFNLLKLFAIIITLKNHRMSK